MRFASILVIILVASKKTRKSRGCPRHSGQKYRFIYEGFFSMYFENHLVDKNDHTKDNFFKLIISKRKKHESANLYTGEQRTEIGWSTDLTMC